MCALKLVIQAAAIRVGSGDRAQIGCSGLHHVQEGIRERNFNQRRWPRV